MRKMLPISAAAVAVLGVAAIAPAQAQTVYYDAPGDVVGGAIGVGEGIVGGPAPRYSRAYVGYAEPYAYAPPPVTVQCGLGVGCRAYPDSYPYWNRW